MKARIDWHGDALIVDFSQGHSLAIDLEPGGGNPSFFADSEVSTRPLAVGGFVGDMTTGGSCNAEVIEFSPHSHGTHTECVGHISPAHQSVNSVIDQQPTLMRIITIDPAMLGKGDQIPAAAVRCINDFDGKALAIRTWPNDAAKKTRNYDQQPGFPVLTSEAMSLLSRSPLLHLLVDTPSVDHADSAELVNHSIWWGQGDERETGVPEPEKRSITEMIFIPDEIPDGDYWLDLQLPPLVSDAIPSRPIIYPVTREPRT